jgi:type IV pilus assembly protein PilC
VNVMSEHAALAYGQLAELLKAGMPLPDALHTLANDARRGRFQSALDRVAVQMERGMPAEEAFRGEEHALGGMLARVAAATAANGKLPELLSELSRWTLAQDRIRREIREALSYPMMVMFLASGLFLVTSAGLGDTIDKFDDTFDATAMLRIRLFHLLFLVVAWIGLAIPFLWACSSLFAGIFGRAARLRESLALRMPLIRAVARPVALTRFCSSVALLTKAGVSFHDAVSAAGKLSGFWPYEKEAAAIAKHLASGAAPDTVWNQFWLFPGTVRFMVGVGAQRGTIAQVFEELARLYEIEAQGRARLMALLLPPLCLIGLGALVLSFMALSILPLFYTLQLMFRFGP